MAIEIVDLPINCMVIFHGELLNYQRVVMEDMKFNKPWNSGRPWRTWLFFLFRITLADIWVCLKLGNIPKMLIFSTGNMMMNRKILGFAQLFPNISSIFPTFFWYHSHAPTQNHGFPGEEEGFDPMGFSLAIDIRWLREASREKPQRSPGFMVKWIHWWMCFLHIFPK